MFSLTNLTHNWPEIWANDFHVVSQWNSHAAMVKDIADSVILWINHLIGKIGKTFLDNKPDSEKLVLL